MWPSRDSPHCNPAVGTPDQVPTSVGEFQIDRGIDVRQMTTDAPALDAESGLTHVSLMPGSSRWQTSILSAQRVTTIEAALEAVDRCRQWKVQDLFTTIASIMTQDMVSIMTDA